MSRRDIDCGALQVLVDDRPQYGSRVRHNHECLAHQILRTDGFEGCETVVTGQNHHQGLLDKNTVRQLRHTSLPPKKRPIDFSLPYTLRTHREVCTLRAPARVRLPASGPATKFRRCRCSIFTPMLIKHFSQFNKVCVYGVTSSQRRNLT